MMSDKKDIPMSESELQAALVGLRTEFGATITPCGSRVTCNPPPTDTDADYLVLVPKGAKVAADLVEALSSEGWNWEGGEHYQCAIEGFMSWRRGETNLIITNNAAFWERHGFATAVCTELNLMKKRDRIVLFQAILYGKVGDRIAAPDKPDLAMIPLESF